MTETYDEGFREGYDDFQDGSRPYLLGAIGLRVRHKFRDGYADGWKQAEKESKAKPHADSST